MGDMQKLHADLAGLHVVLSSQTFGAVDPLCAQSLRRAVMHASNKGVVWESDVSANRMGYGPARNSACELAVEHFEGGFPLDGIMWVDSDIQPPVDAISRLLFSAHQRGLDFLTGVYHQRDGDFQPVLYSWEKRDGRWGYVICDGYPEDTVAPMAGCGFGFVYTSVKMIRDITKLDSWDEKAGKWFPDRRDTPDGFGEDLAFCNFARQAGYQLYVDTGVQVLHTGEGIAIGKEHFIKRLKKRQEEVMEEVKREKMARNA